MAATAEGRAAGLARGGGSAAALLAASLLGGDAFASEQWYRLELDGRRCGWSHREEWREGEVFHRRERTRMTVSRAGREASVEIVLAVEERPDGTIVATRRTDGGGGVSEERHRIAAGGVESTRRGAGGELVERLPRPEGEWLSPRAAAIHLADRRAAGAREIRCLVLRLDGTPEAATLTSERLDGGDERFLVAGREVPTSRWRTRLGEGGSVLEERWSSDGWLVTSETETAAGRLAMILTSEAEALRSPRESPPEVLAASVVRLAAPLPRTLPLRLEIGPAATLPEADRREVRARLQALPAGPRQRVAATAAGVRVELLAEAPASPSGCEPPTPQALAAGPMIERDDPQVRLLADRLGGGGDLDAWARAERLRRGVHRFIVRKDLATTLAGAAETVRRRSGDCSEHAVLLTALLRARGIPARIAVGLDHASVFAGRREVFAWHVWTQAWIDGCWRDLDATREDDREGRRVLVAASELPGGGSDPVWTTVMPFAGRIEIAVGESAAARERPR